MATISRAFKKKIIMNGTITTGKFVYISRELDSGGYAIYRKPIAEIKDWERVKTKQED